MQKIILLIFIILLNFVAFGQDHKLINDTTKLQCEYPRQKEKFKIIKNESLGTTTYKTKNYELVIYENHYLGFSAETKEEAKSVYLFTNKLIKKLMKNGLLTPDLLVKAYYAEMQCYEEGRYFDETRNSKIIKFLEILNREIPSTDANKNSILYEIWVTFDLNENGWGYFLVYQLHLESKTYTSLSKYLKKAKIKCLKYMGIQI